MHAPMNEAAGIAERVKAAFEAADLSVVSDLLAEDVTWGRPTTHRPSARTEPRYSPGINGG